MSVIVVCKCGRDIVLKDEFIGKKVRCSVCKNVVFVKPPEPDAVGPAFVDDPELPNMGVRPQFWLDVAARHVDQFRHRATLRSNHSDPRNRTGSASGRNGENRHGRQGRNYFSRF